MDFKMLKSQEQSEQLQDEKLESIAGGRLNDLVKNLSLRGKVARWAAVAASVVGISAGMVMPAQALNRARCEPDTFNISQGPRGNPAQPTMCFANGGTAKVLIADVHYLNTGNNAGHINTNKGNFTFNKHQEFFFTRFMGTVTITGITIY